MPGNLTIINNYILTGNYYAIDARDANSETVNILAPNREMVMLELLKANMMLPNQYIISTEQCILSLLLIMGIT